MKKILNLTGHDIDFENGKKIPPQGKVRMLATLEIDDFVDTNYGEIMVGKASYSGGVLPTKQDDVMIVVSNVVAEKNKHRDDLFIPWGKSFVNGNKVCRGLQKNPFYFN